MIDLPLHQVTPIFICSIDLEQMSSGEPQHLAKSDEEDETSERLHLRDFANLVCIHVCVLNLVICNAWT